MEEKFLSIVMPVYNEEEIIEKTIRDFYGKVLVNFNRWEFIVVDDCSSDSTPQILRKLKGEIGITVLDNQKNMGHGPSLIKAYRRATGDLIFHSDSDYQINPQEFWKLYKHVDEYDLIIGYRKKRKDPFYRLILSWLVRALIIIGFRVYILDSNSPFRLLKKDLLGRVLQVLPEDFPIPSIAMSIYAKKNKYKVKEIEVIHSPRPKGRSTLIKFKLIKFCFKALKQLFSIKFKEAGG